MDKLKELLKNSRKFRDLLVKEMNDLDAKNINCKNCTGVCCTVGRNSMQVTPIEALDLYFQIIEKIKDQNKFWEKNQEIISIYGLDREIYVKNRLLRKNYTCPLFKFESWGCPIDAHLKPLGCLGYNALEENVIEGENCTSDIKLLEQIEKTIYKDWSDLNSEFKKILNLDFDKLPIPRALEMIKSILDNKHSG